MSKDILIMDDFRDQYNDQFSENNWAQHIICHIDVFKSSVANIQRVLKMGIKRDPLKAVITFLKNKFSEKYPQASEHLNFKQNPTKMEMVDQIFNFVYNSVPHICLKCSQSYSPYTQPSFVNAAHCFLCKIPSHTECCKSDDVDTELGLVFVCKHCISMDTSRLREDPPSPQKIPSCPEESPIQPAQRPKKAKKKKSTTAESSSESLHTPNFFSASSDESSTSEEDKTKGKTKGRNKSQSETDSESSATPNNQKNKSKSKTKKEKKKKEGEKKLCRFFERGICRYGVSGNRNGKCSFHHPSMCKRILQHGPKSPHGCKGDCEKWHPKLCFNSVRTKECFKESCSYWHIKGTIRSKENENQENKSTNEAPAETNSNETPFLGQVQSHLTQMLNQQQLLFKQEMLQMAQCMNQMHRQIQLLARPPNSTIVPQIPLVPPPQPQQTHQPQVLMNQRV